MPPTRTQYSSPRHPGPSLRVEFRHRFFVLAGALTGGFGLLVNLLIPMNATLLERMVIVVQSAISGYAACWLSPNRPLWFMPLVPVLFAGLLAASFIATHYAIGSPDFLTGTMHACVLPIMMAGASVVFSLVLAIVRAASPRWVFITSWKRPTSKSQTYADNDPPQREPSPPGKQSGRENARVVAKVLENPKSFDLDLGGTRPTTLSLSSPPHGRRG